MIGILIVCHGDQGTHLIASARHILNKTPDKCIALPVLSNDNTQSITDKIVANIKTLDSGNGVLILTDIYGASHSNIVMQLCKPGFIEAIAGINLPMLIRTLHYRDLPIAQLIPKATSGGVEGVVVFK